MRCGSFSAQEISKSPALEAVIQRALLTRNFCFFPMRLMSATSCCFISASNTCSMMVGRASSRNFDFVLSMCNAGSIRWCGKQRWSTLCSK